jgi:hypothetical protein
MGIFQPEKGSNMDLVEGEHVPTEKAIEKAPYRKSHRKGCARITDPKEPDPVSWPHDRLGMERGNPA